MCDNVVGRNTIEPQFSKDRQTNLIVQAKYKYTSSGLILSLFRTTCHPSPPLNYHNPKQHIHEYRTTNSIMTGSQRRPSVVAKRTHVRIQKHEHTSNNLPYLTLDRVVIGLSYAGIATYIYRNFSRLSPYEIGGVTMGSLGLGYSFFDLGKRQGITQGAAFALRIVEDGRQGKKDEDEDDWKGEFKGQEFEGLDTEDKIEWLNKEAAKIRDLQNEEQLRCGQAYIKKEEAYVQYEKRGEYGGPNWKIYADADNKCKEMYDLHQRQQRRLGEIKREIENWTSKLDAQ